MKLETCARQDTSAHWVAAAQCCAPQALFYPKPGWHLVTPVCPAWGGSSAREKGWPMFQVSYVHLRAHENECKTMLLFLFQGITSQ